MTDPNHLPPPLPPGHRPPPIPLSGSPAVLRFFIGLLAGAAISVLVWIVGWEKFMTKGSGIMILLVPGLKFAVGLGLIIFVRRCRSFGAGILVSIALGTLVFGGMLINQMFDFPKTTASSTTSPSTQSSQSITCKTVR